jgi:hypothetical protein
MLSIIKYSSYIFDIITVFTKPFDIMPKEILYRVLYHQLNIPFELYARSVSESDMFGFIELEELVFDTPSNEAEEKIKLEFEAVKRSYIPLSNVFRIDAIEKEEGPTSQFKRSTTGNVTVFPTVAGVKNASGVNPKNKD